jgi:hypothetical protein
MLVIREVLQCRPGKVRDLMHKFRGLCGIMQRLGLPPFRLLTDLSGERFWTLVAEVEVPGVNEFLEAEKRLTADPEAGQIMAGYHDLVESGRREIYRVET